jgi:hypothetical protein
MTLNQWSIWEDLTTCVWLDNSLLRARMYAVDGVEKNSL